MTASPRIMASLDTLRENQGAAERIRRSDREIDKYWGSVVVEEPVADDLKVLVRADLKRAWYIQRDMEFRERMTIRWASTDYFRILLEDTIGKVEPRKFKYLYNKPTAFYWLQSAQRADASGQRTLTPKIIFAAIYEEWHRCYNAKPNIGYEHFFANPVRITSTGPSTIQGVINAHRYLCAQASSLENRGGGPVDNLIEQLPSSSQHYSLFPLYHAIIVIIDRLDRHNEDCKPESDGFISLRRLAQGQTVLIARTGTEEGLSAPISLEGLKSQSLPLERSDIITQEVDVVRVSLAAAVQFIVSLEVREDLAIPKTKDKLPLDTSLCPFPPPKGFEENNQVCHSPEAWADALMVAAEKYGYDNIPDTWASVRRVQAGLIREGFCELKLLPLAYRWK
ncbi:hypothetical protein K469DRAFT_704263 [Zopfia rhizophila CBS 207.26]|uniref:Uncharacterized protein n=1 Tax=Zopfia rhizophila CBS 207.26 TaxID=1314779 RepID=A0A6A6E7S9_9PEZI|nr:hypothetical protein K469DRAFT_704263 [Zopfia rhizophila CBS 207.26]